MKQVVIVTYHINEGEVTLKTKVFYREEMMGFTKISEKTDKKLEYLLKQ